MITKQLFTAINPNFTVNKALVWSDYKRLICQIPRFSVGVFTCVKVTAVFAVKIIKRIYNISSFILKKLINLAVSSDVNRVSYKTTEPCGRPAAPVLYFL